jgi:succinate-semialdehyde dehydrogenase/glutarate-semialdehyde dehydrogenase
MERAIPELKDKSLFIQKAYVNGEWVDAKSGKTFEVHGIVTNLR